DATGGTVGSGDWSLTATDKGTVSARGCLTAVAELSDEAVRGARAKLNPADGTMVRALWAQDTHQLALIIHHLAVDGVSWRILLEDLNIAWAQHNNGQSVALPTGGTSLARWSELLAERARDTDVVRHADTWRTVASTPAALPPVQPELDTYASAGRLTVALDEATTRKLLGEVPAAFHAGVQDILLIAFGLAWAEFSGAGAGSVPMGIDVEGHGRAEDLAPNVDLSRTVGWFTAKYPVALTVGRVSWTHVTAGASALGPVIKAAKEQLRALPDGLTYGLLRYLNPDVDLGGSDPTVGFNYLGRLGAGGVDLSEDLWRISQDNLSMTDVASAVPMALAHSVELNAGTLDSATGPQLQANWMWAPSVLSREQVDRLSRLWFEALTGICTHVGSGGGGLTPSDVAPLQLTQEQVDELTAQYRIADVLPLTPLQKGLLFQSSVAGDAGTVADDVYAVQLAVTVTGELDPQRLRQAVTAVIARHPNLAARFHDEFGEPVQVLEADPVTAWQYAEPAAAAGDVDDRL
ncbi:condensation domain-containing protein, partial [Mycobacteriaceae bacterium Msp059]|nr:condensation domain-containing protein [Mycobacteriaceae bacterium Msp059]